MVLKTVSEPTKNPKGVKPRVRTQKAENNSLHTNLCATEISLQTTKTSNPKTLGKLPSKVRSLISFVCKVFSQNYDIQPDNEVDCEE